MLGALGILRIPCATDEIDALRTLETLNMLGASWNFTDAMNPHLLNDTENEYTANCDWDMGSC